MPDDGNDSDGSVPGPETSGSDSPDSDSGHETGGTEE